MIFIPTLILRPVSTFGRVQKPICKHTISNVIYKKFYVDLYKTGLKKAPKNRVLDKTLTDHLPFSLFNKTEQTVNEKY